MDPSDRRKHLLTEPNPDNHLDYVVSLTGQAPLMGGGHARAALLYVPDKSILKAGSLARYLETLAELSWGSLEEVAVTVRDDINNEVVPRWLQITVSAPAGEHSHGVVLEDRQPRWDNPALLSRLRRY